MDSDAEAALALQMELDGPGRRSAGGSNGSAVASSSKSKPALTINGKTAQDPREALHPHLSLIRGDSITCGECAAEVRRKQGKTSFNNVGVDSKSEILRQCHVVCGSCFTLLCAGCGEASECERDCESEHSNGCPTANHCPNVRAVLMYEALAAFDRLYIELKRPLSSAHPSKKAKAGQGVGYGKGYGKELNSAGEGDDAEMSEDSQPTRNKGKATTEAVNAAQSFATKVDAKVDKLLTTALETVLLLTPRSLEDEEAETYDYCPSEALLPLLQLSWLPDTLSELLRNDAIGSVSERLKVYTIALGLLQRFASCAKLTPLLVDSRRVKAHSDGLGSLVSESGRIEWEYEQGKNRGNELVTADPLYSQFKRLVRHSDNYLKIAKKQDKPVPDKDNPLVALPSDEAAEKAAKEERELATKVIAMAANMEEAIKEQGLDLPGTAALPVEDRAMSPMPEESAYKKMHEELAFAMVSDIVPQATKALGQGQSMMMTPANQNHLNRELSNLESTLPPGIFIRVDEGSVNEMRALIAGPADTPYESGLFEFSFKLPWDYPARSPTVKILTTAGGRVRFNPNLYAEGKVCLSLLGTWQGAPHEMWLAWKSTLAQVLISIQSMIMVDEPHYNEPGMAGSDVDVANYNKNVRLQSVRWAMIDWLDETHLKGLWGEVIRKHFTIRRAAIRAKLQKWSTEDPRMTKWDTQTMKCCGSQPPTLEGGTGSGSDKMNLVQEFEHRMDLLAASS